VVVQWSGVARCKAGSGVARWKGWVWRGVVVVQLSGVARWCSGLAWRGARLGLAWRGGGAVVWRGELERLSLAWCGGAMVWRGEVQGWVLIL